MELQLHKLIKILNVYIRNARTLPPFEILIAPFFFLSTFSPRTVAIPQTRNKSGCLNGPGCG